MARFLVSIDPLPALDDAFLARLQQATRKHAKEWGRELAAPLLARALMPAETQEEAKELAGRLAGFGFVPHIVAIEDVSAAVDAAFEATWAERVGDVCVFISENGSQVEVPLSDIRALSTGRNIVQGKGVDFVTVGLRVDPGAVILRFPGSDISKLAGEDGPSSVDGAVAGFASIAPHAKVDRGLDGVGKLPAMDLTGSKDLAHVGVISAFLLRRFPPAQPRPAGREVSGPSRPSPASPPPRHPNAPLELNDQESRARHADAAEAVAKLSGYAPVAHAAPPEGLDRPSNRRKLMLAAGALVLAVVGITVVQQRSSGGEQVLKLNTSHKGPGGATFHFKATYDAGIQDVRSIGFVIDVEKGGDTVEVRVPSHEATTPRTTHGISWKLESYDDAGAWVIIAPGS